MKKYFFCILLFVKLNLNQIDNWNLNNIESLKYSFKFVTKFFIYIFLQVTFLMSLGDLFFYIIFYLK
jgi:hypothetical protein